MLPLSVKSPTLYHAAAPLGARFFAAGLLALAAVGVSFGCASAARELGGGVPAGRPTAPPAAGVGASPEGAPPLLPSTPTAATTPALATAPPPLDAPAAPEPAEPRPSFFEPLGPFRLDPAEPAMVTANLSAGACRRRLAELGPAVKVDKRGYAHVALPVRIRGSLRGVRIRTAPASSVYGVLDCRLALAFDAMARVLSEHDVAEVRIGTIYRPGATIRGRRVRSQHAYALAADVVALVRADGRVVPVEGRWGAGVGETACGPTAVLAEHAEDVVFLRNAICALARQGVFHHILTPSADGPHDDHIHLDVQRGAKNRWIR